MLRLFWLFFVIALGPHAYAQSGNSTSITGTVVDPSGAVVVNAAVEVQNPVSGYSRNTVTDSAGKFVFPNVPFNPYHLTVTGEGFAPSVQDVDVRSSVPLNLTVKMNVPSSSESVTVETSGEDLLENTPTFHTDVDRDMIDRLPLESASSSVSSLVTLASPGVAADSNGLFHGLGDHAENSFSVDGQPITDQQSKVFSNQIPLDSIQSMEVIAGAPPAEYGDKTSLVIDVTTRSGQGMRTPHGGVTAEYGNFGTSNVDFNLGYGGKNWGNFISVSGLNTGRFLDPPEFTVMHDKGNEENVFDRVDYQISNADSIHTNLQFTRSWFQTPNSFDQQNATAWSGVVVDDGGLGPNGLPVGPTDQRSQIKTFNIAPAWTHLLSDTTLFTLGAFVRRDQYNYYPSANPFADLSPDLQNETVGQNRTLTNTGLRSNLSYVKGIHNLKVGATYQQTFLDEHDNLGIVNPTLNPPSDPNFNPLLLPFDLTRGGSLFTFNGHTDVKELGLYLQDAMTVGNWNLNLGVRGDLYNGLTTHREAEPRLGIAYNVKPSNTILRVSYARVMESPFNENLILSSIGCANPVLNPLLLCSSFGLTPLSPGWRNEFHAGFQQALENTWCSPVSTSGSTRTTASTSAYSATRRSPSRWNGIARRFPDSQAALACRTFMDSLRWWSSPAWRRASLLRRSAAPEPLPGPVGVFRIDHDEKFNETTHIQYQPWKRGPWMGFNWRYDSGLVAGPVPCAGGNCINGPAGTDSVVDASVLSPDQQFQGGLFCGCSPRHSNHSDQLKPRSQFVPGLAVRIHPHQHSGTGHRERRPQSSAHSAA